MAASRATVAESPRRAIELELSIGTMVAARPPGLLPSISVLSEVAISRAPALRRATIRLLLVSRSMLRSTARIRATLSAKSATTIELRLAVIEPSRLTRGRSASSAWVPSMLRVRMISVTKLLALPRPATRPPAAAPVAIG